MLKGVLDFRYRLRFEFGNILVYFMLYFFVFVVFVWGFYLFAFQLTNTYI